MKKLENKKVSTASEIEQAIKDGYKYALQMEDPSDVWVSQEMNDDDLAEIYGDYMYEFIILNRPEFERHMGCPIGEAIEWFGLK